MIRVRGRNSIPVCLIGFGRHLIYAEGTKTELLYAESLRDVIAEQLNVSIRDVEIIAVPSNKTHHTLDLIDYAIDNIAKRRAKGETIDHVWIFYDKDDFKDFDDAYLRIKRLNDKKIDERIETPCDEFGTTWHACWSNECFEVWVYHYFENLITPLPRDEYEKRINKFLKHKGCLETYSKTRSDLHTFLTDNGGSIEKAIKWMIKKDNKTNKKPNPSSGVYLFAQFIKKYLDYNKKKDGGMKL